MENRDKETPSCPPQAKKQCKGVYVGRPFNAPASLGRYVVGEGTYVHFIQNEKKNPVIDCRDTWWTNKKKHRNKDNGKIFFQ